jgi:uncharacterized protein (TIGR03435 family)
MMRNVLKALFGLMLGAAAFAQTFDSFEVSTIKPTQPEATGDSKGRFITMPSAHRFVARNHTVSTLIGAAYNLTPRTISGGPAWAESDRWDILAGTPGAKRPNIQEQMGMLRQLLTDRFQLKFHWEQKEMPYYALTVAKGGPKLREGTDPPEGPKPLIFVLSPEGALLPGRNATMGELASVMQRAAVDRPVLDKTGVSGRFDFDLQWAVDETQFGGNGPKPLAEPAWPDLYAALQQQLGLKLEAGKGPVNVLVIDGVERPSEN